MRTKLVFVALLAFMVSPALSFGAGTVSGKITYTGTPAKQKPIDMSKEPSCAKQHTTPVTTETVVTGANNTLANVVVYISAGAPEESSAPAQAVTFTPKGCQYIPQVLAMRTGQELKDVNADQTAHTIHPLAKVHRGWNQAQHAGTPALSDKFDKVEVA